MKLKPFIKENEEHSFVDNTGDTRRSTFKHLETGRRGEGCDRKFSFFVVEQIRKEGILEEMKVGIDYTAKWNIRVINPIDTEEQVLVATEGDNKVATHTVVSVVSKAPSLDADST